MNNADSYINRSKRRHTAVWGSVLAASFIMLAGCGSRELTGVSGKLISKDGSIQATIVRDFDESLYSVDKLKAMMDDEIASYNFASAGDNISAGEVACTEGVLTCVINYLSDEDYSEFNSRYFVIEGFDEAMDADLVKISLKSVDDLSYIDIKSIDKKDNLYVLITDEPGVVTCPGQILYISDGVNVVTKKQADVTDDMDGLAYIIYENK